MPKRAPPGVRPYRSQLAKQYGQPATTAILNQALVPLAPLALLVVPLLALVYGIHTTAAALVRLLLGVP